MWFDASCFTLCLALGLNLLLVGAASTKRARRQVLLLSFDGFRWDYIGKYPTPHFDEFRKDGVCAKTGLVTAFITKTFPDHYTIATGLYEESHGIVANKMYDPLFNESFTQRSTDPKWWDGGEPIWITAKLRGLRSASLFWPGSEVKLKGVSPDFSPVYNKEMPFIDRVDTVIGWLKSDVDVVVAYFHEPDGAGHKYGPMSIGVGKAMKLVDDTLGYLIMKLKENELYGKIDILAVSDHGLTNVTHDSEHTILLNNHLDFDQDVEMIPLEGPVASIMPKKGQKEVVFNKLRNIPHVTVYKKEDIPDHYHYKNNRRIMDIQVIADEGFFIQVNSSRKHDAILTGEHGYDNRLSSMKPVFMAHGPDFKKDYVSKGFETVNIYPLICHLLGIQPAPNNGSLANVQDLLNDGA